MKRICEVDDEVFLVPLPVALCSEGEYIWFVDMTLGGLFKMDSSSLWQFDEVINAEDMFANGFFRPVAIISYDECIWIIPDNLCTNIVVYQKASSRFFYYDEWKRNIDVNGACICQGRLYIFPLYDKDAILCADLRNKKIQEIEISNPIKNDVSTLWEYCVQGNIIYVPRCTSCGVIRIDTDRNVATLILKDVLVMGICVYDDKVWILPREGHEIYIYDRDFNAREKIEIRTENKAYDAGGFLRIISTELCVVLLPLDDNPLMIYWNRLCRWEEVESNGLEMVLDFEKYGSQYYHYYIRNDESIEILPARRNWLSISLRSRNYGYRYMDYRKCLSIEDIKAKYFLAGRCRNKGILFEQKEDDLKKLIKFMSYGGN